MRIAITGTPGVGKTTLAQMAGAAGFQVVDLKVEAQSCGAVIDYDAADDAMVIDDEILADHVAGKSWPENVAFEGHLSHFLPVDAILVIRLDPDVLRQRLTDRGYAMGKITENLEAEALDLILQEALDADVPIIQRDGTRRTPEQLWAAFADALAQPLERSDLEQVDWSHRLPV